MNNKSNPGSESAKDQPDQTSPREKPASPVNNAAFLSSLRIPNFRYLLTGTVLTNAAQFIQQVTLNWLVYNITGSGAMLGYINLVRSAASLGMVPAAGVLIDRLDRRKLMLMTNGWLFTITLILGLLMIFGPPQLYYLFVFSFLAGLVQTIDNTLRQVIVFNLVPRAATPNALAIIQTGWGLMRSIGPAIGGFLILWFGPGGNFLVQAGAYGLVMLSILRIQFSISKPAAIQNSAFQNIKEGMRYLAKERTTRTFMFMGFVLPLFIVPVFTVLTPIYAKEIFHGGPDTLGLLMAFTGVGGIIGGISTVFLNRVERRGVVQLTALFILGLSLVGFAFITQLWTALLLLVIIGFFEMIFLTSNQTLLQLSIPDNLRGRVTAVVNLNAGLMPVGGLIAGFGSDLFGGPQIITVVFGSISAMIAILVFSFTPIVRNYRLSHAISQGAAAPAKIDSN
jgi:MFS transporter, DHA1 family, staphyloferrin A biosynthesis exporter